MRDLIQTLVARTLGLEPVMQPSVGSLYEPDLSAGWQASEFHAVDEEVVLAPPRITLAAGISTRRPASPEQPGAPVAERDLSSATASLSLAQATPDTPAPEREAPTAPLPLTLPSTNSLASPPSSPPAPRTSAPTPTLPRKRGRENVVAGIEPLEVVVRGDDRLPALPIPQRNVAVTETTEGPMARRRPAGPSPTPSDQPTESRPPRGALETIVRQWQPAPEPGEPGRREPPAGPAPATPGAEREPPVIQVTIGRVEVRAIAPPPAAAPAPPRRRPFPSLEDYLERTSEART